MERGGRRPRIAALVLGLAVTALFPAAGCVDINGGAVEISWWVFTKDGHAITDCACADPQIPYVRLNLVSDPGGDLEPCAGSDACRFSCHRKTGATPFVIPPGRYLMSLVAVGADGVDLPGVQSPSPQSRVVVSGQPTELEAYVLYANCAMRCNSSDITQPCSAE